jgi:hypothetical protein
VAKQPRSVRHIIFHIMSFILPVLDSNKANKVIKTYIDSLVKKESTGELSGLDILNDYLSLTLDQMKDFYDKSLSQMKSLEDKAKISIVGVTIAVSLVTSLAGFLSGDVNSYAMPIKILVVVFGAISLSFFIMSGWISLIVLGGKNITYQISPEDMRLSLKERLEKMALYIVLNIRMNLIRNNYIYTAYRSILYALISLSIMFVLIAIGAFFLHNGGIMISIG